MTRRLLAVSLVAAALVAVTAPAGANPADNGRYLNGRYLNGRYLNGVAYNGRYLNGRYLNGPTLSGSSIESPGVAEGGYLGGLVNGVYRQDLVDTQLSAWTTDEAGNQEVTTLKIDAIVASEGPHGVPNYVVSFRNGYDWHLYSDCSEPEYGCYEYWYPTPRWDPVCPEYDDAGLLVANRAVVVDGTWEYRAGYDGGAKIYGTEGFTFACRSQAIGKCVDQLGYKPWTGEWVSAYVWGFHWKYDGWSGYRVYGQHWTSAQTGDLAHQACTRMVRADYCGDGTSHTEDGTGIDVGDELTPRVNTLGSPTWGFEGVWGADGTLCMSDARYADAPGVDTQGCMCPEFNGNRQPFCWANADPRYVTFAVGECDLLDDSVYNRSETLPMDGTSQGPW